MLFKQSLLFLGLGSLAAAWLPKETDYFRRDESSAVVDGSRTYVGRRQMASYEIRGVNLGSLFIVEPWMARTEWESMGCGNAASEFDCVVALGQDKANAAFTKHWESWITEQDLDTIKSYGLNTIRVPIGYWIKEDLVYKDSEHFPQGGLAYLDRLVGWASDRNLYIILDLHGAPGAQVAQNPFTGQNAPSPGFFQDYQYKRATDFLSWLANRVHTNNAYRGVGAIEVLNEPAQNGGSPTLISSYYPAAMAAIRGAEAALGIVPTSQLHVQMMDKRWGAGDPVANLANSLFNAAYDNHRYLKWDPSVAPNKQAYLKESCHDDLGGNWPLVVGEWSLSPADSAQDSPEFDKDANKDWYKKWWAAQVMAYEKQDGWVFWSWKTNLGDYRWDYQAAVGAGVIPKDPGQAYNIGACNGV